MLGLRNRCDVPIPTRSSSRLTLAPYAYPSSDQQPLLRSLSRPHIYSLPPCAIFPTLLGRSTSSSHAAPISPVHLGVSACIMFHGRS